jgi:hypothetical protein
MVKDNRSRYTDNEATNTSLGQLGSVYQDGAGAITPPAGLAFIAITIVKEATFNSTDGLVPEDGDGQTYISTEVASTSAASGGTFITSDDDFAAGITMFGRWSTITVATGNIIAYVG